MIFLSLTSPVLHIGISEPVIQLLSEIIERTREEKDGLSAIGVGALYFTCLGQIHHW